MGRISTKIAPLLYSDYNQVTQGHLDLDVSGVIDVLLNKESIVPETGRSLLGGKTKAFPKETRHKSKFSHGSSGAGLVRFPHTSSDWSVGVVLEGSTRWPYQSLPLIS